jgi:hypothetical protein
LEGEVKAENQLAGGGWQLAADTDEKSGGSRQRAAGGLRRWDQWKRVSDTIS